MASMKTIRTLVYGIGNPGRGDDGLGPRLIQRLEALGLEGIDCDSNYQLNVEDALSCSKYETVIFVDASETAASPFEFKEIEPSLEITFTSHEMSPASILALSEELYGRRPKAWLLAIRGHAWDMGESLSSPAEDSLDKGFDFLVKHLKGFDS